MSDLAVVTSFTPAPKFPPEWWQELDLSDTDPYTATDLIKAPVGTDTWLACALWIAEDSAPPGGYALWFPTAADALLWFRWLFLATSISEGNDQPAGTRARDVKLNGEAAEIAHLIDDAPNGTLAVDMLARLEQQHGQSFYFGNWELYSFQSIHTFMSEAGTLAQWRSVLNSEMVDYVDGQWSMPDDAWQQVRDEVMSAGGGCSFGLGNESDEPL